MSVRLHYAKEYKITWGDAGGMPFYSRELLRVIDLYDVIYYKDDGDDEPYRFDIPKGELRKLVDALRHDTRRHIHGVFETEDLIAFFSEALENADAEDGEVHFEWF